MGYVVVMESDSTTGETTSKIMGLTTPTITHLENHFSALNISYDNHKEYFEVDVQGVLILNLLSNQGYRVISQSMAIEYNTIGGRSIKIQKIVWTLGKNV